MDTLESNAYWGMNEKSFLLLMHLSQLAGFLVPGLGLALPIVMWVTNKDSNENINQQGKYITNWILSMLIYAVGSAILIIIVVGIFALIALAIVAIVFPIIGAVKSNNGEVWKYPLTIQFIK